MTLGSRDLNLIDPGNVQLDDAFISLLTFFDDFGSIPSRVPINIGSSNLNIELFEKSIVAHPVRNQRGDPGEPHHPVIKRAGHAALGSEVEVFVLLGVLNPPVGNRISDCGVWPLKKIQIA